MTKMVTMVATMTMVAMTAMIMKEGGETDQHFEGDVGVIVF